MEGDGEVAVLYSVVLCTCSVVEGVEVLRECSESESEWPKGEMRLIGGPGLRRPAEPNIRVECSILYRTDRTESEIVWRVETPYASFIIL